MNHEIDLINSIIDSGEWTKCIEQNIQTLFVTHKDIWTYISDYVNKYESLPTKSVVKERFPEFEFLNTSDIPVDYYIDEARTAVLNSKVRGNLQRAINILKDAGPYATMNYLMTSSSQLMKETGTLKDTNLSGDFLERVQDYEERISNNKHILGIPSGIAPIDEIFGGWQPGDFIVLMGWTGSKKTWLSMLFACNAWLAGYRPLIISLEMNKFQMGHRLDTILGGGSVFTNDQLTNARELSPNAYREWAEKTFHDQHPFYLVTAEGLEVATQNTVQAKIEQYRPDLVVLDYHGLFEDANGNGNETDKAKNLSKAFKRLALQYDIPIIDVTAVTMQGGGHEERPPELSEVAWSKQLAYDADLVLAIHSPKGGNVSQIVSRKVRRCQDFAFYLDWDVNKGTWKEKYENAHGIEC